MICPGTNIDCDNVGCRRGGCQGRLPELPLFQANRLASAQEQPAPVILLHPQPEPSKPAARIAA
jgi:hypothetical protein